MSRKLLSILLLLVFGFSSFTVKTHYCYDLDGSRFHGDCGEDIRKAEAKEGTAQARFYPLQHICYDLHFDKQYQQPAFPFPDFQDHYFILPEAYVLPVCTERLVKQDIPVFSSRGGPPLSACLLRGPPAL